MGDSDVQAPSWQVTKLGRELADPEGLHYLRKPEAPQQAQQPCHGSDRASDVAAMSAALRAARVQAWRRRWRISGPTLLVGALLMPVGLYLTLGTTYGSIKGVVGVVCATVGSISSLLAILPGDRRVTGGVAGIVAVLLLASAIYNAGDAAGQFEAMQGRPSAWKSASTDPSALGLLAAFNMARAANAAVVTVPLLRVCCACRRAPASPLRTLWRAFAAYWAVYGALQAALGVVAAWHRGGDLAAGAPEIAARGAVALIAGLVTGHPRFREVAQAWLATRGEAVGRAAGISELLGEKEAVDEIMSEAAHHFRCVPADRLTEQDMMDQVPNPSLHALTEKAEIGQVDAFLSHSWHDDPGSKWAALQLWRSEFKLIFGREPRLWIDKYCIDQTNIQSCLKCLPVYLAGCRGLVALCGATYTTRLWCLVEVFVFLEMGGALQDLQVIRLGSEVDLSRVDLQKATCSLSEETRRLQSVLEAGRSGPTDFVEVLSTAPRLRLLCSERSESGLPRLSLVSSRHSLPSSRHSLCGSQGV